jgi:hypothetical protein
MRRIATETRVQDAFGEGRDGFTDPVAEPPTAPTVADAEFLNNVQEEIVRAIEGNGATVRTDDEPDYSQLDDAVNSVQATAPRGTGDVYGYVIEKMTATTAVDSLDIELVAPPFEYVLGGRRYVVTQEKLEAYEMHEWELETDADTYFYVAPEDPTILMGEEEHIVDREGVYIETITDVIGSSAPAVPSGMLPFLRIRTGASGVVDVAVPATWDTIAGSTVNVTSQPLKHGTPLVSSTGRGIMARASELGTEIVPTHADVRLGAVYDYDLNPEQQGGGQPFADVVTKRVTLRGNYRANQPNATKEEYGFEFPTASASATYTHEFPGLNSDDYDDGAIVKIRVEGVAMCVTNADNGYAFSAEWMAFKDAGGWDMDGSEADVPQFERGTQAIADTVTVAAITVGDYLAFRATGHSAHALEWFIDVSYILTGRPP